MRSTYLPVRPLGAAGLDPVLAALPGGGIFAAWEEGGDPDHSTIATLVDGAARFHLGEHRFSGLPQLAQAGQRVVLVISRGDAGRGGTGLGPVTARVVTTRARRVRVSRPQLVNLQPARDPAVAGGPSGRATVTFLSQLDSASSRLQPQVATLDGAASAFAAPVGLLPADDPASIVGPLTPAVAADGTARVLLDGRLTAASTQACCTFDPPLLGVLAPGAAPATAPAPGAQAPPAYDAGALLRPQSGLIAGGSLALRAPDGSWSLLPL